MCTSVQHSSVGILMPTARYLEVRPFGGDYIMTVGTRMKWTNVLMEETAVSTEGEDSPL